MEGIVHTDFNEDCFDAGVVMVELIQEQSTAS